jgi:hypothetical protein
MGLNMLPLKLVYHRGPDNVAFSSMHSQATPKSKAVPSESYAETRPSARESQEPPTTGDQASMWADLDSHISTDAVVVGVTR